MRKLAKLVGVAVICTMATAAAGPALALPTHDRVVTYFDSPGGGVVGMFTINCLGHSNMLGIQTPYAHHQATPCDPDDPGGTPPTPPLFPWPWG